MNSLKAVSSTTHDEKIRDKDRFIAGNVIAKTEWIEKHLKEYPDDKESGRSLEALKDAAPEPIGFELLDFNLGERWIPTSVYEEFAEYLFGVRPASAIRKASTSSA